MKKQLLYKETQPMTWFVLLFLVFAIFILLAGIYQWGTKPIPLEAAIPLALFFCALTFPLYKLVIEVSETEVKAYFGIGWIKRRIAIKDLDLSTAEIISLPWYAGIGYRISNRGTFMNTRPGAALFIKTKNKQSEFFVGTKNASEILKTINRAQQAL